MQADSKQTTIVVRVPFAAGTTPTACEERIAVDATNKAQASSYKQALLREIASAAGDVADAKVSRLVISGATPHSMALDFWEKLMDALEASFPGTRLAHVRFDAAPRTVDVKAMAYAVRYHSVVNMLVDVPARATDGEALASDEAWEEQRADIAGAIEAMDYERFGEWGFEFVPAPSDETSQERMGELLAFKPAYLRMVTPGRTPWGAGCEGAQQATESLRAAGYEQIRPALFARHPKFRSWFERPEDELVGFGPGTTSRYAGMSFSTKADVALYIEQAGLSSEIYENAVVAQ